MSNRRRPLHLPGRLRYKGAHHVNGIGGVRIIDVEVPDQAHGSLGHGIHPPSLPRCNRDRGPSHPARLPHIRDAQVGLDLGRGGDKEKGGAVGGRGAGAGGRPREEVGGGENPGSKLRRAQELGKTVLGEEEFTEMVK